LVSNGGRRNRDAQRKCGGKQEIKIFCLLQEHVQVWNTQIEKNFIGKLWGIRQQVFTLKLAQTFGKYHNIRNDSKNASVCIFGTSTCKNASVMSRT